MTIIDFLLLLFQNFLFKTELHFLLPSIFVGLSHAFLLDTEALAATAALVYLDAPEAVLTLDDFVDVSTQVFAAVLAAVFLLDSVVAQLLPWVF